MEDNFVYDPNKDISPVDEFGFVDLRAAFVNHSIPGDLQSSEEDFNGVDDPQSLIGKTSDVFDALRKAEYVKGAESAAKSEDGAASSPGNE